jgi:hypothetical protein
MNAELRAEVMAIIKANKYDIWSERDWWYGLEKHSINVHNLADEDEPEQMFSINVYQVGANGLDDYSHWEDLEPITSTQLLNL